MSFFNRGFRRPFRPYRASWYRGGYNRRWRRGFYRRGVTYNSRQGRRSFNVSVPVENVLSVTVPGNESWSNQITTCPYMGDTAQSKVRYAVSLMHSLLYRTYTKLYDQVKVNSVSIAFDIISPLGAGGLAPAIKVYTTWDRCYDYADALGSAPTGASLTNGSESMCKMFVNNSRATLVRYNRASDLQERSTYHDCSYESHTDSGSTYYRDISWMGSCKFYAPSCCFAIQTGDVVTTPRVFPVSIRATYNVTFRNPKYGLTSAPSKSGDVEDLIEDVEPVKVAGAGKESSKPTLTGMAKDAVARLALNVSDNCDEYVSGENDWKEDMEFLISKVGIDGVRSYFPEGVSESYDEFLKERGVMSDDPTEVVKDSKS